LGKLAERKGFEVLVRFAPAETDLRSQLSHYAAPGTVDFTLPLSSCRFHDASTNEISSQNTDSKKPSKTMRFQGLCLVAGTGFEPVTFRL
jgi:hypothetical protein